MSDVDVFGLGDLSDEAFDLMKTATVDSSDLKGATKLELSVVAKTDVALKKETKKAPIAIPQPPAPTREIEKSVPNTYSDLHDSDNFWLMVLGDKDSQPLADQEIDQLLELPLKIDIPDNIDDLIKAQQQKPSVSVTLTGHTEELKLNSYIDKMPHGVVDKKVAGIGATTLEIKSKRHSIIVFPTKILAYNKWIKHKDKTLYVGGKVNGERGTTVANEIIDYLTNKEIAYKKILVVADSLPKLLKIIGKENFENYFLMIDEVDMIQSESNYRPRLEFLIDYYFLFPPKNRCLVTATMREFSNPHLQQECKFKLTWKDVPRRNIQVYYTDNLDAQTALQIKSAPQTDKVMIAFNSIQHCKNIIKLLPDDMQGECAILCSNSSVEEAGDYYAELTQENKLPRRICFVTSCYFAGVDIEDIYHLITVSNARQNYQMLSLDKITQIHGRCRVLGGILSDTIIHNIREKWKANWDENYQTTLLKQANAILQLQTSATALGADDKDLQDLFEIVKTAIRERGVVSISKEGGIQLTRKDGFNKESIAYMNIDYLVERQNLSNTIYDAYNNLRLALETQGHMVKFKNKYGSIPLSEDQQKSETADAEKLQKSIDAQLFDVIEELRTITKSRLLTKGERNVSGLKKNCSVFLYRFYELQEYADADTLIKQLWEIRYDDRRAFKNLKNAAVFWALDDAHPFKQDLFKVFEVERKYTATEIEQLMIPIVKYHLHKTIRPRASISLLKALFLVERPKNYLVKSLNPMEFQKQGSFIIPKTEDNLMKYFQI